VIVSEDVCANAGVMPEGLQRSEVAIRGRDQVMAIFAADDATSLAALLDAQAPEPELEVVTSA
jgi:hypothetical protein